MKSLHVVVPELFPAFLADKRLTADLDCPVLKKMLARGQSQCLPATTLENELCRLFGVEAGAVAPLTLRADGVDAGEAFWFRADPVYLNVQPNRMVVQTNVTPTLEEADALCRRLNAHFEQDGLKFIAPHPTRWYLKATQVPELATHSISEVDGRDARHYLPQGKDALRWNAWLTEIQMLLATDPSNRLIEARGGLAVNSLWLWGGGRLTQSAACDYAQVSGGDLPAALARAAGVSCSTFGSVGGMGDTLWVWEDFASAMNRGDWYSWRAALSRFELECLFPAWTYLRRGEIDQLRMDVLQENGVKRIELTRWTMRRFWRAKVDWEQWAAF